MFYGVSDNSFLELRREIDEQNKIYAGRLEILMGIEADFMGGGLSDIPNRIDFDLILIGYHRGIMPKNKFALSALCESFSDRGDADKNTDEVLRTFDKYKNVFAMTHPNEYIKMNIDRLSREAAQRGIFLEINNRHITLSEQELRLSKENGAGFIISSDGHLENEMCCFDNAIKAAESADVLDRVINYNL